MIASIRNKGLRRFAETGDAARLSVQNADRVRRILNLLDHASTPEEVDIPGLRFHSLSGTMAGRYAVAVSGNWRITFGWADHGAVDVDLEDYH